MPGEIPTHYYKLPYIGPFSNVAQNKIRRLLEHYCHNLDIKLVFSPFSVKDPVSKELRSQLSISLFVQAVMLVILVKPLAIFRHALVSIFFSDRNSHIYKHFQSSELCRLSCSEDSFTILDTTATKSQIRLEEAMFICWEKPVLNQQLHHVNVFPSF